MQKRLRLPVLFLLTPLMYGIASPVYSQTVTYIMKRMTAAAGAATTSSLGYQNTVLVAQQSVAGAASACNAGNIDSFGFWSTLGDLPVPIILRVQRNAIDPGAIDLAWTGTSSQFQVCRDTSPVHVCEQPYAFPFVCQYTDTGATGVSPLFYSVIPKP